MRLTALAMVAFAITTPALADTFAETIAFSGNPDDGGNTVYGPLFNPALGTLTGVKLMASGTYTPDIFVGAPVNPASLLKVDLITFGPGGGLTTLTDGAYTLTQTGGFLTGPPESFNETASVTNAAALSLIYTAFGPNRSGGLLGLDVFSVPAKPGAWGQADDVSPYAGKLKVVFSYTPVPEPASLMLLGVGGLLALLARSLRPARRRLTIRA